LIEKQDKELERLRLEAEAAAELRGRVATLQEQNDKLMDRLTSPEGIKQ
jgi:cell shape-determining protein MreC